MAALPLSTTDFRALAAEVTALASDYLAGLGERRAFPQVSGKQSLEAFADPLPEEGLGPAALGGLQGLLELSRAPSPRFFGYVLGSGEPVAALADLLASVLNQNVTAWRSAPAAVALERQLIGALAAAIGCPGHLGSFCGGGSMANLMGLAMAREARLPANDSGVRPGVVYASSEVHMSIPKAMALLGLGRERLRLIPTDDTWRMSVPDLRRAIAADHAAGVEPLAVVATSGTVNTGSIDPLAEIAAVCREHGLWMHVDGAYGALAALAIPERFSGLNAADSVSLDPHKWLYQPLDCGVLLFRDAAAARKAFSYSGDYARPMEQDPLEGFAFFEESLELSRRFRALKLWLSVRYHGLQAFRRAIRDDLQHAQLLAQQITATSRLELAAPVSLSAVCFRYCGPAAGLDGDQLNAAILKRVIERGGVYLSNATLRGRFVLRACFVNHRTTEADVARVVPEVLAAADEALAH
ncbi:MAG: aminotransferase class V-fold PLP-dependent enzyme [Gammaproteobacteria bacterium]|nr:aminotransferase class V-fold PLP-dependent enzyme [Gammaproteobacteria bacterium]